jgi:toxin ParE1/3/4
MVVDVTWTKRSLIHLEAELAYYGQINSQLAKELSIIIKNSISKIQNMPGIGQAGKKIGSRELILQTFPYIIVYRVRDNILEILSIVHQKRKNVKSFY